MPKLPIPDYTIEIFNHVTFISRGDDIVGHVIPTWSGYAAFVFNEETGDFEEVGPFSRRGEAVRGVKKVWPGRTRYDYA